MERYADVVRKHLSRSELLCQLAEECSELCQAALKLRRVETGDNPTPLGKVQASAAIYEEMADILCVLGVLGFDPTCEVVNDIQAQKLVRWAHRLEERDAIRHS